MKKKASKAFNAVFITVSTISALIFLGLLSSQAELPKVGMLIGQEVNSEPSDLPSPSVAPDRVETPQPSPEPSVEPSVPSDVLDKMEFKSLNAKILEIGEKFAKVDPKTHLVSFDIKAAKEAGYNCNVIQLVKEQFDVQNELVEALKSGRTSIGEFRPSAAKYPKWKKFLDRAKERRSKKPKTETSSSETVKVAGSILGRNLFAVNTRTACGD
jgi:hypothetical protein